MERMGHVGSPFTSLFLCLIFFHNVNRPCPLITFLSHVISGRFLATMESDE